MGQVGVGESVVWVFGFRVVQLEDMKGVVRVGLWGEDFMWLLMK